MKDCRNVHVLFSFIWHSPFLSTPHLSSSFSFSFSSLLYLPTHTAEALQSTTHPNLRIDTACTPTPHHSAGTTSHSSKSLRLTEELVIQSSLLHPSGVFSLTLTSKAKSLTIVQAMIHGSHQWTATVTSNHADSPTSWPLPRMLPGTFVRRPQLRMPSLR